MEELIPLLLFVIFGILSAIGKARKNKKQPTAQRRKGLVERFITWLFDLQKRIEEQSKKIPKGELDWEELLGRSKPRHPDTNSHDDARQDIDLDPLEPPPSPLPEAGPAAISSSPHQPKQPLGKMDVEAVERPGVKVMTNHKPMPGMLPKSSADLRKAIVWSEIIGPPVALRKPFGDHR